MKPLIGITPQQAVGGEIKRRGTYCDASYSEAVARAGGVPVVLPLTDEKTVLNDFIARCDGFLLTGGGDMTEASGAYGRKLPATVRKTLGGLDPVRDTMEMYLAQKIAEADLPVLGICRGIQVMNVALGGTLHPNVPGHRRSHPFRPAHRIEWAQDGRLPEWMRGCDRVNSTHHQALHRVAPMLHVVARADDGIIEAVELPGARFCFGVQFHPERLLRVGPEFLRLFRKLVAAANSKPARR